MTSRPAMFFMDTVDKNTYDFQKWLDKWMDSPYQKWFQEHRDDGWQAATPDTNPYETVDGNVLIIDF